jgi:DNA mismatch repair ATPase MutS
MVLSAAQAGGLKCDSIFNEDIDQTLVQSLASGKRIFKPESIFYSLDSNTKNDLKVQERLYPDLNHTRTVFGAKRLAWLLENPYMSPTEIINRQNAVKELLSDRKLLDDLRAELDKLKPFADEVLEQNLVEFQKPISGRARALLAGMFTTLTAVIGYRMEFGSVIAAIQLLSINMNLAPKMNAYREVLTRYKRIFRESNSITTILSSTQSEALQEIQVTIAAVSDSNHPKSLSKSARALRRMLEPGALTNILDFFYGHSAWSLRTLQKQLLQDKAKIALLVSAIAELDVYVSIAESSLANREQIVFPEISRSDVPFLKIVDVHHPYLFARNPEKSVPNGLELRGRSESAVNEKEGSQTENINIDSNSENHGTPKSDRANFAILTGPNAGGKSTFLNTIALTTIRGQIGAPVALGAGSTGKARAFIFTPVEVMTNIDISDSVEQGKSFFKMESRRLAQILERMRNQPKLLVIMDEILLGTNRKDRDAIQAEVVKVMAGSQGLSLLATHDIEVTHLANTVSGITNLQVEEIRDNNGNFQFSFKIVPGVSESTTAYEVLRAEGVPADLVERALKARFNQP